MIPALRAVSRARPSSGDAPRWLRRLTAALALAALSVPAPSIAAPATRAPKATTSGPARSAAARAFRHALDAALEHYGARRFAEARAAFLQALALAPPSADGPSLEFNIAACDYELGEFRAAEARFARVARADPGTRSVALLHAGWAALGAGDDRTARAHLDGTGSEPALEGERTELARAIDGARSARESAELTGEVEAAARAYEAGEREHASAIVRAARAHEDRGTASARAALAYIEALLARDGGDDEAARSVLQRSVQRDPGDASARVLLAELALARGDRADAELQYRASLGGDLSARDAGSVREALAALYGLPPRGLDAWGAFGAGYDSNATLSGSGEALGYAGSTQHASPFVAPAWGLEQRWGSGERSRIGAYYAGDWLLLGSDAAADASLMTHETGVRFYYAPTAATELRLAGGAGLTFSGHGLSPFSLDAVGSARFTLRHGARWRTYVLGELRPSVGLGGQSYLDGARADLLAGERLESGRWSTRLSGGWRHNGIGTWSPALAEAVPGCFSGCEDARYRIPLGYSGPLVEADASVALGPALELGASMRYEYRTFLDESGIQGADVPAFVQRLSSKTREDDLYTLGGRARYRLADRPELAAWLRYALRLSRSNVASGSSGIDHAFDYDDRNFNQHVVELGLDARY